MNQKQLTLEQIRNLEFHPLANEFPLLEGEQLKDLALDIGKGWIADENIVLYENKILDGRNRYLAAREQLKLTSEYFRTFDPDTEGDPVSYVIAKNLHRRHLSEDQRAMIAAKLYAKLPKEKAGGNRKSKLPIGKNEKLPSAGSQKNKVAAQLKVSVKKVDRAASIHKKDAKKAAEVQAGTKKIVEAEQELAKPQRASYMRNEVGVNKHIPDKVRKWFWDQCEKAKVPYDIQVPLAVHIAEEAAWHHEGRLSLPYIKHFQGYIAAWDKHPEPNMSQQRLKQILDQQEMADLMRLAKEVPKTFAAFSRASYDLLSFTEEKVEVKAAHRFRLNMIFGGDWYDSLRLAKELVDKMIARFG